MQIVTVDADNLMDAARIHAESWRESHKTVCSSAFVALHTTARQAAYLQEELRQGKKIYMLADPEPVGIVSVQGNLIENLYILPEKQGGGYGSALLKYACEQCEAPSLWVLSSNEAAIRFYKTHGFCFTGNENPLRGGLKEQEMRRN